MKPPLPIGVLLSGGGRTLINLADRVERGGLRAAITVAIASREDCPGVQRARQHGLEVRIASATAFPDETARHDAITRWLVESGVELVCLGGYLRWLRIDPPFVGRVINIHPALLPEFGGAGMYGMHVHRAVLATGRRVSGCTVHFVDELYDHGPVILQRLCPVRPGDDPQALADRVFRQECIAYPEAVQAFAEGRVRLAEGRAELIAAPRTYHGSRCREPDAP